MRKAQLLDAFLAVLEAELNVALAAVEQAHETATHEQNIPENQYDTLGLEAAYLAHGQAQRVVECKEAIARFKKLPRIDFDIENAISLGTAVTLELESGDNYHILLSDCAGGNKVKFEGLEFQVVSLQAPLGQALMGQFFEDEVAVNIAGTLQRYVIVGLF